MASLTVRQLDEKLKKRLRLRAAKSGRSVEDEVRTILREAAEQTDDETRTPEDPAAGSTQVRAPLTRRPGTASKRCCSSSAEASQPTSRSTSSAG